MPPSSASVNRTSPSARPRMRARRRDPAEQDSTDPRPGRARPASTGTLPPGPGSRESPPRGHPARTPGNPRESTDETAGGGPKAFLTACARPQPGVRVVAGFLDEQVSSSRSESWCSRSSLFPGGTAYAIDPSRTATCRAGGTFRGRHLLSHDHEIPGEPPSATFAEPSTPSMHSQIARSSRHSSRATGQRRLAGVPWRCRATVSRGLHAQAPLHEHGDQHIRPAHAQADQPG